jgi:hypothetical protein
VKQMIWRQLKTLVLVAGHAVYVAPDFAEPQRDESWLLQPFQRGEPPFYLEHIKKGIELAAHDASAMLVLSGGQPELKRPYGGRDHKVRVGRRSAETNGYWSPPRLRWVR